MAKNKKKAEKAAAASLHNPFTYKLIGDKYYLQALVPTPGGGAKSSLLRISRRQVEEDLPQKEQRECIPRFTGFVNIPLHIDYQRSIGGFYNRYYPLDITPEKGSWSTIDGFLDHIFGAQKSIAMDYLALTYLRPEQRLPVLVLVSRERGTGKTTFLNLLNALYGDNMAFANPHSMRSRFNADWAGKLIIAIDEALLDRRQDSEQIKALATSTTMALEAKGVDRISVPNFSRIILCSNNLDDPILIDDYETRYWVVEVPPMPPGAEDPNILAKMNEELPAYCWYLAYEHHLTYPVAQSRLWFPPSAYTTEALRRIKRATRSNDQQIVAEVLLEIIGTIHRDEIYLTLSELQALLKKRGFAWVRALKVLHVWRSDIVHAADNLTYDSFFSGGDLLDSPIRRTGRYYILSRQFLERYA